MSGLTPRFGFTFFGGSVEGSLNDDGQKYTLQDRLLMDRLFTAIENHDYAVATEVTDPSDTLTAVVSADQGGTLEAGRTFFYAVSFVDSQGLETRIGNEVEVSTPDVLIVPSGPSTDVITEGNLQPGVYYYAITALRGEEETPISAPATVTLLPGDGGVMLAFQPLGDAERYRVWRMGASESGYTRIGFAEGTTFTDGGEVPPNPCPTDPNNQPPQFNAGIDRYSVEVTLGSVDAATVQTPGIRSWRLYRSEASGNFGSQSLVHEVVETVDELDPAAARMTSWVDDGDLLVAGRPTLTSQRLALKPYTFPAMDTLPATTDGYPDNYPLVVDGVVHFKSGSNWVQLGSGGGSDIDLWSAASYDAGALVVHNNALWRSLFSAAETDEPNIDSGIWRLLLQGGLDPAGVEAITLLSPNGSAFRLSVNDDGTLATAPVEDTGGGGGGTTEPDPDTVPSLSTSDPTAFYDEFNTASRSAGSTLAAPWMADPKGSGASLHTLLASGYAYHDLSVNADVMSILDSGSTDVDMEAYFDLGGMADKGFSSEVGFVIGMDPASDYWITAMVASGYTTVRDQYFNETSVQSGHENLSRSIRVRAVADRYRVWVGGALVLDVLGSTVGFQPHTNTHHGLYTKAAARGAAIGFFLQRPSQHAPGIGTG